MITFVDVREDSWYYEDFIEAANTTLKDGTPLIEALPYNVFTASKPYVLKTLVASTKQRVFEISDNIDEKDYDNLFIFINGVQTSVVKKEFIGGNTRVTLYQGQPNGTRVTFLYVGEPEVDQYLKRPVDVNTPYTYPQRMLDKSQYSQNGNVYNMSAKYGYFYESFYKGKIEEVYLEGTRLSRITIPTKLWKLTADGKKPDDAQNEILVRNFIGLKPDVYTISPWGRIYLPYNANGARVGMMYSYIDKATGQLRKVGQTGYFIADAKTTTNPGGRVLYNNRIFPEAIASRADAVELISRLREYFYDKFTDSESPSVRFTEIQSSTYEGQRIFNLNNSFEPNGADLKVYDNSTGALIPSTEYDESPNGHTVIFKKEVPKGKQIKFTTNNLTDYVDVGVIADFIQDPANKFISTDGLPKEHKWSNGIIDMFDDKTMVRGTNKKVLDGFLSYTNYQTSEQTVLRKGAYDGRTGVRPCVLINPVLCKPSISTTGSIANPYGDFLLSVSKVQLPKPSDFKIEKGTELGQYDFSWSIDYTKATANGAPFNNDSATCFFELWVKRVPYNSYDVTGEYELLTRVVPQSPYGASAGTVSITYSHFFNGGSSLDWVDAEFKVRAVSHTDLKSPFSDEVSDVYDSPTTTTVITPAPPPTTTITAGNLSISQGIDNYIDPATTNTVSRKKISWSTNNFADYYVVFLNQKPYARVLQPPVLGSGLDFTFNLKALGKVIVKAYNNAGSMLAASGEITLDNNVGYKIPSIGDYYRFGTYSGDEILWRVIDVLDDGNVLLMSDKILTFKAFSAAGNKFLSKKSSLYGSNYWLNSSLREWLNSSSLTVTYSKNKPTQANVANGINPYDTEKGFLNEFTQDERLMISPYERNVIVSSSNINLPFNVFNSEAHVFNASLVNVLQNYDNTYQTLATDLVFLPSVNIMRQQLYPKLSILGATYYKAKPTDTAVAQSSYNNAKFDVNKFCEYWLETPDGTSEHTVRYINDYGIPKVDNNLIPVPQTPPATGLPKYFFADTPLYRGELVRVMNWFRLWCIDRFKRYTK